MSTMPPVADSPLVVRSPLVTDPEVTQQVSGARRSTIAARVAAGFGILATLALVAFAAAAWSDWYWEWSQSVRASLLAMVGVAVIASGWQGWRRWIASYTLWRAAANVEQREPRLGQRLRTTLDYGNPAARPANASPRMVESLHADTRRLLVQTQWTDPRQLTVAAAAFVLLAVTSVAWVALLAAAPEFRTAAGRMLLLPWEYTEVSYKPTEAVIKAGESLPIEVLVTGRAVSVAKLRYRLVSAEPDSQSSAPDAGARAAAEPGAATTDWQEIDLVPRAADESDAGETNVDETDSSEPVVDEAETRGSDKDSDKDTDSDKDSDEIPPPLLGTLVATLDKLTADVEFEVVAGPKPLPLGRVRVLQPLTLESFDGDATPPAYTGLAAEKLTTPECSVREGSTVSLRMKWNRPPAKVTTGEATPTVEIRGDTIEVRWDDLRATTSFDLIAEAADGIVAEPVRIKVRVQMDQQPKIHFVEPPEELEVTPTTEVSLNVSAGDDLGLHKVGILCQVGGGPMLTIWEQDFAGIKEPVEAATALMLEDHQVTHQDAVTYYAFAEDNYFNEPRRVITPLRFIDIRPFMRAYQMLDNGGS